MNINFHIFIQPKKWKKRKRTQKFESKMPIKIHIILNSWYHTNLIQTHHTHTHTRDTKRGRSYEERESPSILIIIVNISNDQFWFYSTSMPKESTLLNADNYCTRDTDSLLFSYFFCFNDYFESRDRSITRKAIKVIFLWTWSH